MGMTEVAGWMAAAAGLTAIAGMTAAMRREPAERRFSGVRRLLYLGYAGACLKRWIVRRCRIETAEDQYYREMYINENPGAKRMEADCMFGIGLVGLLFALSGVLFLVAYTGGFSEKQLSAIERPESGTGIARIRARFGEKEYDISLPVAERLMTAEEIRDNAAKAEEELLTQILGDNESADRVTKPLALPSRIAGTPIAVSWSTSDYRIVDYSGNVHPEYCEDGGSIVTLTAQLTYRDWEETLSFAVRVLPKNTAEGADTARELEELLTDYAQEQAYESQIHLPEELGDGKVSFYAEQRYSAWVFFAYAGFLAVVLCLVAASRRKQNRKTRERQLLRDYPELVSKVSLLIEAGSTIRLAWERIVGDYVRHRDNRERTRYVYEEMLHTRNLLSLGIPEEKAYEEFGKRCGNIRYLRFSSIIVQNLKKGAAGLLPLLQKESAEAFCDRREQAKQRGEEAGTKLLLPMAGILVIILAMILIPAFMSL